MDENSAWSSTREPEACLLPVAKTSATVTVGSRVLANDIQDLDLAVLSRRSQSEGLLGGQITVEACPLDTLLFNK
jgi:hypothetical protein